MISRSKHEWFVGILISLGIIVTVIVVYQIKGFEWAELRSYDVRFSLRGPLDMEPRIVLVSNDEETAQRLGKSPDKISRSEYAKAIGHLKKAGAEIIAFDMIFSGRQSSKEDSQFEQAMRKAKNIVLSRYIAEEGHITPLERFHKVELGEGIINVALDSDGILRSMPILGFSYENGEIIPYLTLSAEIARLVRNKNQEATLDLSREGTLTIGSLNIPYPQGKILINFFGPAGTFPNIPLWRAIAGDLAPEELQGKIVILGGQAATLHDFYQTAYKTGFLQTLFGQKAQPGHIRMMGAEVHAHALMTILNQAFIERASRWTTLLLVFGVGIFGLLFMVVLAKGSTMITILWATLMGTTVGGAYLLFVYGNYWLEVIPLLATINGFYGGGMAFQRYILKKEQRQLLGMFSGSLSPNLEKLVWENRDQLLRHEQLCLPSIPMTTLFASCINIDAFHQHSSPQQVMALTNDILTALTKTVTDYEGIVEESTPDSLKAIFGVPEKNSTEPQIERETQKALNCAMALKKEFNRLHTKWKSPNLPMLKWQIVIHTDVVTIGIFGQFPHAKIQTVGQTSTLVHQLEQGEETISEPNNHPGQIIISDSTLKYVHKQIDTQYLANLQITPNQDKIPLYRVTE